MIKLDITDISYPTPDTVTLTFGEVPELGTFNPGQHGIFVFDKDGESFTRTYSFHSVPQLDRRQAISIRAVPGGSVSNHVLANEVRSVYLKGIYGDFFVTPTPEKARHLIMFAGGSGITPLLSMLRAILFREPDSRVSLVYSNKSYERIIFRRELTLLEQQFGERLNLMHFITGPGQTPQDFRVFHRGRLSRLLIRSLLKKLSSYINLPTEYYLCGPYDFIQLIQHTLEGLGLDRSTIFREHFFIPGRTHAEEVFKDLPDRQLILRAPGTDQHLKVGGGKTILEAALADQLNLPYSCQEGKCGVCKAWVLKGDVRLRKNHALNDEDLQDGQVLLCQAIPMSDDVIIRVKAV